MSAPLQNADRQVPIKLTTSLATLSIPDVPYLIPTAWRRTQLSTLVNRLLQQSSQGTDTQTDTDAAQAIPFDFIIDGEILRTSLDQYLDSKNLTEESTLVIEYVRSTLPPKFTASFEHDDWISSVDASRSGLFLTSSYDGSLRVFGTSTIDTPLATFQAGASASLTDACWLPGPSSNVATVGMDGALRVCSLSVRSDDLTATETQESTLKSISYTHSFDTPLPLSSVASNKSGDTLLTAGWDGSVAIWDAKDKDVIINDEDAEERGAAKRRKGIKGKAVSDTIANYKPLSVFWHVAPSSGFDRMPGSNARVSRAVWTGERSAVSAGWDGNVKGWDIREGTASAAKTSDKVILALDVMHQVKGDGDNVITGHMDRSAALWDLRTATTNISISFPNAHAAPISVVRAHPTASHLFATGAHDGTVKLWDCRSPRAALFSVIRPTKAGNKAASEASTLGKILALDWDLTGQTIVAGGEDCQLTVHHGHGIGAEMVPSTT